MNQSTLLGPVPPGSVLLAVEEPIETAHGLVNIVIKKTAARSNARAAEELTVERNALMTMGKHPFILELCGSYNDPQGNEVMLTEYVNGSTLWRLMQLRPHGHVPEAWTRFYATELVLALEHVHASCLIHRHVAPENVIVATNGHLRLTSFNSASLVPYVEPGGELRIAGQFVAPEMLVGGGYGASVDWWALGCMLHQMFGGRSAEASSTAGGSTAVPTAQEPAALATLATLATSGVDHAAAATQAAAAGLPPDSALGEGAEGRTYSPLNLVSAEAAALVERLLIRNPERRIGTHGVIEIKMHAWFNGIDWDAALRCQAASAPWFPNPPDVDAEAIVRAGQLTQTTGTSVQQGVLPFQHPPVDL